ncbi:GLYCOSYL HYDROLASE [Salix viminalis]|uniref:GLYCOSYL HYDROLASE n=1 Tax=Salix viminalis TaxID=40686 RepID=A0A9Q0QA42_SALVM|nr:GLYCOSYL HYDROLASE [Salix viminalis]
MNHGPNVVVAIPQASLHLIDSDWQLINFTGGDSGVEPYLVAHNQQLINFTGGDSGVEPYLVAHNQHLAHASAVKFQITPKGFIGINTKVWHWFMPYSEAKHHQNDAKRPLVDGIYAFLEKLES